MTLQNAFGDIALDSSVQQTVTTLAAIQALTTEVRTLSETMNYFLSSVLEKMPRVDATDRVIVNTTETTAPVTISSGTVTTLTGLGGRDATYIPVALANAGANYIYDNVRIT